MIRELRAESVRLALQQRCCFVEGKDSDVIGKIWDLTTKTHPHSAVMGAFFEGMAPKRVRVARLDERWPTYFGRLDQDIWIVGPPVRCWERDLVQAIGSYAPICVVYDGYRHGDFCTAIDSTNLPGSFGVVTIQDNGLIGDILHVDWVRSAVVSELGTRTREQSRSNAAEHVAQALRPGCARR